MKFKNEVYDILKWLAMIVLNAVGVCYCEIADIWGLPFGLEVMKTLASLSVLLGALIGISSAEYYKEA